LYTGKNHVRMESTLGSLSPVNHQSVSSAHEEQFTVNHVNDIRAACVCLLDAVANIISVRHHESLPSYRTLTQNMVSMVCIQLHLYIYYCCILSA